jgi:hypothetical protein
MIEEFTLVVVKGIPVTISGSFLPFLFGYLNNEGVALFGNKDLLKSPTVEDHARFRSQIIFVVFVNVARLLTDFLHGDDFIARPLTPEEFLLGALKPTPVLFTELLQGDGSPPDVTPVEDISPAVSRGYPLAT